MNSIFLKWANAINNYSGNIYSQIGQDIFVLSVLNNKKTGFFVEFGALDGKYLSNSYLLETKYDWKGILVEPGKQFHDVLKINRSCMIDHRAVTDKSGMELLFKETDVELGMSGLVDWLYHDMHADRRRNSTGNLYSVHTVNLNDLFEEHQAPYYIDYVSIDTEGSELAILENFDFSKHKISIFTIEHNYTANREKIKKIMHENGYTNVLVDKSKHDDWFVLNELIV
jgi:FkbM family methyltransferase